MWILVEEKLDRYINSNKDNERKSVNQQDKESTIKGVSTASMSGNPQLMRLTQKYNQIKNK